MTSGVESGIAAHGGFSRSIVCVEKEVADVDGSGLRTKLAELTVGFDMPAVMIFAYGK